MSRINQALSAWEANRAAADKETRSGGQPSPTALNQYADELRTREEQPAPAPETRASASPREVTERPSVDTAVRPERRPIADRRPATALDVEARLVTNPSNALSIEQYRRMAAALHDLQLEKQLKTALITSAVPQEGKTLTLYNLALTLSESYGRRVLMIDADLRRPALHLMPGISNGWGLCDTLRDPRRELPVVSLTERLSVLTGGHPEGIPLAALSSPRMSEVIDECAAQFDWVLIDTPPIGILPDASVLARLVDGVIFVIRADLTPSPIVERAIGEIGPDSIIGLVLNRVQEQRIGAASYYHEYTAAHATR